MGLVNSLYGKWTISAKDYTDAILRYDKEIGNLDFCAIQDYMCEPWILKKTGLSVKKHQELTCRSYLELKSILPDINFIPILQGWNLDDYLRHIELYNNLGINLFSGQIVGLGSVCRRESTNEIKRIVTGKQINT